MKEQAKIKHLEDALQKYRLIFQHAPLGIYHVGIDGYITDCNQQLAEIMGTDPNAIIGINVLELEDQAYMDAVRDAMAGNLSVYEGSYESILGGKNICLRALFAPVEKNSQGIHEVVAILEDVTVAKEAEEKLRKSEERWQIALENSGDGVWDWHIPSGETQVTENWLKVLGYKPEEIDYNIQGFHSYVHPEDQSNVTNQMAAFTQDQVDRLNMLFRMRCKNGAYKWFSTIGKMVEWTDKKEPLRAIGTHRDVTEQQQMVEALSESERSKSVLLSNLPGMAYRCEYKDHQWEMTYISEGCYELTGYHPAKLRLNSRSLKDLILPEKIIHPDHRESLWEKWLQIMREEQVFRSEYPIITANQQLRWVWEQGRILTDDLGRVKALECFVTDITERKVAEEKNRQLDRLKDEFLANTSHELRTPLNGIINIAESLIKGIGGPLSPEQEKNLQLVRISARRLSALVNDILDFSRIKHHDLRLHLRPVDLYSQVEIILELLKPQATLKNIQLLNRLEKDSPLVLADENRLSQILFNLVGNALRYTEEGIVTITGNLHADMMTVSVTDTGIGIPEKRIDSLFEYYEQAGLSPEREYTGTGLGLPISRKLVELHGGKLEVSSMVGHGSVFSFSLPLLKDNQREETVTMPLHDNEAASDEDQIMTVADLFVNTTTPVDEPETQLGEFTVMVVDDEPVNIQSIINVLSLEGINVIPAANGEFALEVLQGISKPDLCMIDIMMPKMNGFELCKRIRGRFTGFEMPVIFLTARYGEDDIRAGFAAGGNDFLHKPFEEAELVARVETLLNLKKSVQKAMATEIAFLQAQIKPHFLYNALNTIAAYCETESEKAGELILSLSTYLRGSLSFDNLQDTIPLVQELELTKAYVDIEKARFPTIKIEYNIEVDDYVTLPPLTIQPLVENAIRHGVCKKKSGGTVWINVLSDPEGTFVLVEDDGIGVEAEQLKKKINQGMCGKHVGLCNIQNRLNRMYGRGLEAESQPGKGTKMKFFIPGKRRV